MAPQIYFSDIFWDDFSYLRFTSIFCCFQGFSLFRFLLTDGKKHKKIVQKSMDLENEISPTNCKNRI